MKKEAKEQLCEVSCASDMLVAPFFFICRSFLFQFWYLSSQCTTNIWWSIQGAIFNPYFSFFDGPSPSSTKEGQVFGMTWRFLPACDPLVSVTMSRDLDSRLTARFCTIMINTSCIWTLKSRLLCFAQNIKADYSFAFVVIQGRGCCIRMAGVGPSFPCYEVINILYHH